MPKAPCPAIPVQTTTLDHVVKPDQVAPSTACLGVGFEPRYRQLYLGRWFRFPTINPVTCRMPRMPIPGSVGLSMAAPITGAAA